MNKPFEVCLLLVLLFPRQFEGTPGKGQQQTGIEDGVILAPLSL